MNVYSSAARRCQSTPDSLSVRKYEMYDDGSDEAGYRVFMFHFLGFLFCPGCRCFHTRQALEHVSRCCAVAGSGLPHTLHTLRSPMGNAAMMVSSFTGFTSLADSSVTPCNDLSLFF